MPKISHFSHYNFFYFIDILQKRQRNPQNILPSNLKALPLHRFCHLIGSYTSPHKVQNNTALVAKLVDALDLGSSGLGRVGSSPIRRTEENPNCLIISS